MKNELARELSLAEGKHQYDNQVKRVLSNKIILAGGTMTSGFLPILRPGRNGSGC